MRHVTMIQDSPGGHLGICECGDRDDVYRGYGEAAEWCDKHEHRGKYGLLNLGSRRPALKTVGRQYREKSLSTVYTPEEREQWRLLADGIDEELERQRASSAPMPGQIDIFSIEEPKEHL